MISGKYGPLVIGDIHVDNTLYTIDSKRKQSQVLKTLLYKKKLNKSIKAILKIHPNYQEKYTITKRLTKYLSMVG